MGSVESHVVFRRAIVIFDSARTGLNRVWRVPATGGPSELETVYPATGTLSRDGRRLAYVEPSWFWGGQAFAILRMELSSAGGKVASQNRVISSDGGTSRHSPPLMNGKSYSSPAALEDPRYGEAMRMVANCCK
jgi:hypothetical protein